jgi:drug/metabolite transporter (DMT)-like permease
MARSHLVAVLQALLVTFLWSTSWVLIKIGLADIPALTFAGLRYFLAFGLLLVMGFRAQSFRALRQLSRQSWGELALLGLVMYTLTQGLQFLALVYLPAQATSLLISFTPVIVALFGSVLLAERASAAQWLGVGIYLVGAALFLLPLDVAATPLMGLIIALATTLANACASLLGRLINRRAQISPFLVTVISMGIGSSALLLTGLLTQGMPSLGWQSWLIVIWLAVVNTAFAFTLWNLTLRSLSAVESSTINNTMLIQIAVLAWIFLGETLNIKELLGLILAALGVAAVQLVKVLPYPKR